MPPTPLRPPSTALLPTTVQPAPSPSLVRQRTQLELSIAGHQTALVAVSLWDSLLRLSQHIILNHLTPECTHALFMESMERRVLLM